MDPAPGKPPNVLLFVMDDQRLDDTMAVLPVTRAWFHQGGELPSGASFEGGTHFPNGIVTSPLCAPSRASILTGRFARNHGVQQNRVVKDDPATSQNTARGPARFFQQIESSLPRYLQSAGYRTCILGRYFALLDRYDPELVPHPLPGWDEYAVISDIPYAGFDVKENGARRFIARYSTDYIADRAERFLEETKERASDRPWFLYVAPATPHSPFVPAPRHADADVPPLDTTDPAYFERDRRDKPPWVQTAREDADATERGWSAYLRTLKSADDLVERVMRKLEELDETDTIAFYTSDHGFLWGEHGLKRKEQPYLESIRVPYFVRWPGRVRSRATDDRIVANIDIAPTILDAVNRAGGSRIEPRVAMDGASLLDEADARAEVLSEHFGAGPPLSTPRNYYPDQVPSWTAITSRSRQDVEYYRTYFRDSEAPVEQGADHRDDLAEGAATPYVTDFGTVIARERYDLASDPKQLTNLLAVDEPATGPPGALGTLILPSPTFSPNRTGATFFVGCPPSGATDPRDVRFEGRLCVEGRPEPPFRACGERNPLAPRNFVLKTYDGLESGTAYTFEARAVDRHGNVDPAPASYTWRVGPVRTFDGAPELDAPDVTGSEVRAIVADGNGGWYIGGDFTTVGGLPRANLAHIVEDPEGGGLVVDTAWTAGTDGPVHALVLVAETLYLGGEFGSVSGANGVEERGGLAALTPGGALAGWDPKATDRGSSRSGAAVRAIELERGPGAACIYVAGDFSAIGGAEMARLAKLDLASGAADQSFDPTVAQGTIHALAATEGFLYVGGRSLSVVGGKARGALAELDRFTGEATDWNPAPDARDAPVVCGLHLRRGLGGLDTVVVTGHFSSIGTRPEPRSGAAEVNLADDGTVTHWDPRLGLGSGPGTGRAALPFFCAHPGELAAPDPTSTIIVAGEFDTVKTGSRTQSSRIGIAETDRSAGDPSDTRDGNANDWNPHFDGAVVTVACHSSHLRCDVDPDRVLAVGGAFANVGGLPRGRLAFFRAKAPDGG
jgi:arylsulfatase A-like enzyme